MLSCASFVVMLQRYAPSGPEVWSISMTDSWANSDAGRAVRDSAPTCIWTCADPGCAPGSRTPCARPCARGAWRPAPGCRRPARSPPISASPATPWPTPTPNWSPRAGSPPSRVPGPGWPGGPSRAGPQPAAPRTRPRRRRPTYGLLPGSPDLAEFPRTQWLAAARRALTAAPHDAFGYGDALGRLELRTALADYLARARGVYAEPERIVICSGLPPRADADGAGAQGAAGAGGGRRVVRPRPLPRPADRRRPAHPARSTSTNTARAPTIWRDCDGVGAVLLTPAHQYPTGVALQPGPARGGGRLGARHRRADPGGRLRRGVPIRPPAGGRAAGPRPGAGGVLRHGEQVAGAGAAARLDGAARANWSRRSWRPRGTSTACRARWTS